MKSILVMTGMVVFIIFSAFICVSAMEFSADMISKSGGQSFTSKIYMKDKKVRTESRGQPGYSIVRQDKNVVWVVMPDTKTYMEMAYDPAQSQVPTEKAQGEVSRKLVGKEKIDGHPTEKYLVTVKEKGKTSEIYQWIATDLKFPVKTAAVDGSYSVEYKNIKMSAPDNLFEIPGGYQKVTMPAMPKGMMKRK